MGNVLAVLLVQVFSSALYWGPVHSTATTTEPRVAIRWLATAGITPDALAAAGVTPQQTGDIVASARSYLEEHAQELSAASASVRAARLVITQGRPPNAPEPGQEPASVEDAENQLGLQLDALLNTATQSLTPAQRTTLQRIRDNRKRWDLPVKYLVMEYREEEWLALRQALAESRIAGATARAASLTAASVLEAADTSQAVLAADNNHSMRIQSVRAAWRQSLFTAPE